MERNKWGEKMLDFMPNASRQGRSDVRLEIGNLTQRDATGKSGNFPLCSFV